MLNIRNYIKKYPALHYRDFRLLWTAQIVSVAGSQMQVVALNWHIYVLTKSAVALGIIGLVRVIPIIIFSLIGGSLADTHNRKTILFITQLARGTFSALLAVLTITGEVTPLSIYILTALSAVAVSMDVPARQALVPSLVKKEHLSNAVSLNVIMFQVASIAGPVIAGFTIAQLGVASVYIIDALSFVTVICALLLMKSKGSIEGPRSAVSLKSVKEGLQFVLAKPILWSMMLLDFVSTFFSSSTALLPIYAEEILHTGPKGLGLLYAAPAVGALIAGFVMAHTGTIRKQGKIMLLSVIVYALGTILFGFSKTFFMSFVALFIVGAGDSVSAIIRHTIRQVSTPDNMRGRVVAISMIFFQGGPQLGEFEAGIVAALIGAPLAVITGGTANIVAVLIMAATIPALRDYDRHEEK